MFLIRTYWVFICWWWLFQGMFAPPFVHSTYDALPKLKVQWPCNEQASKHPWFSVHSQNCLTYLKIKSNIISIYFYWDFINVTYGCWWIFLKLHVWLGENKRISRNPSWKKVLLKKNEIKKKNTFCLHSNLRDENSFKSRYSSARILQNSTVERLKNNVE